MLKLMPVTDREALERYAAAYNVPVDEGLCLTIADQRGECLGVCFYHFTPEGMQIEYADANGDGDLFDGLLRASMAALMDKPEDTVTFSDRVDHELLRAWSFLKEGEVCVKSANAFFETCKKCKN